jgi:hypothetical protein
MGVATLLRSITINNVLSNESERWTEVGCSENGLHCEIGSASGLTGLNGKDGWRVNKQVAVRGANSETRLRLQPDSRLTFVESVDWNNINCTSTFTVLKLNRKNQCQ